MKENSNEFRKSTELEETIRRKNAKLDKGIGQKIKCGVTDCAHNCLEDSTCRLECITVNISEGRNHASEIDGTCCKSYYNAGDLNKAEITGRD